MGSSLHLTSLSGTVGAAVEDLICDRPMTFSGPRSLRHGTAMVNGLFMHRIVELTPRESQTLLPMLDDQFKDPEIQCRFKWEPGDIAIWDNRAVQHYASPDYEEVRVMHRVVLAATPRPEL